MKAHKIGLPTFEASVSCGAYCQGGSVNMQPTTYPEFTDADEVWVKGEDAAKLAAENATLRSTIDDLTAGEIHTCHDHCQRTACILRRENTALRSRLAETKRERDMLQDSLAGALGTTDKLAARLAEAEAALRGVLDRYVGLVNSGDAGNWDCETEPEVIAARRVLATDSSRD